MGELCPPSLGFPLRDKLLHCGTGEREMLLPDREERESRGLEQQLWNEHWVELKGLDNLLNVGVAVR